MPGFTGDACYTGRGAAYWLKSRMGGTTAGFTEIRRAGAGLTAPADCW